MTEPLALATSAVRAARAEGAEAEAVVQSERSGLVRFADSTLTQPTLVRDAVVTLRVARDGRVGAARGNRLDEDSLRELARRAAEAAATAPEDDFDGFTGPEEHPDVEGFDERLAELDGAGLAARAREAIAAAAPLAASGYATAGTTELAIATSGGLGAAQRMTDATTVVIAGDPGRSGYAERTGWRLEDGDGVAAAHEAAERAARSSDAARLEPGVHAAVLEPYAVAGLLQVFAGEAFGALGVLEGRSWAAERLGRPALDERITLADDALDPRGFPKAFDFEGAPKRRVDLVENGVVRGVLWDRATARRAGGDERSTGHALPLDLRGYGPLPSALSLAGGEAESVESLVRLVGEGVYVTRLHYVNAVDPRDGVVTATTRDGTFRIRGGELAERLEDVRVTVSVPRLLTELIGLTRDVRLVNQSGYYGERYPWGVVTPALATAALTVTGAD